MRAVKTDCVAPPAVEENQSSAPTTISIPAEQRHCERHYLYKEGNGRLQLPGFGSGTGAAPLAGAIVGTQSSEAAQGRQEIKIRIYITQNVFSQESVGEML